MKSENMAKTHTCPRKARRYRFPRGEWSIYGMDFKFENIVSLDIVPRGRTDKRKSLNLDFLWDASPAECRDTAHLLCLAPRMFRFIEKLTFKSSALTMDEVLRECHEIIQKMED